MEGYYGLLECQEVNDVSNMFSKLKQKEEFLTLSRYFRGNRRKFLLTLSRVILLCRTTTR